MGISLGFDPFSSQRHKCVDVFLEAIWVCIFEMRGYVGEKTSGVGRLRECPFGRDSEEVGLEFQLLLNL
jgi:hypothetical protein